MEDATHALLQDFVDSLANLPSEVSHLLTEVAFLDYAKSVSQNQPGLSLLSSSQSAPHPNDATPPVPQHGNGESGDQKRWYSVEEARRKAATKHSSIVRHAHRPPNNLMTPNPKEAQLVERADAHYDDAVKLSMEKERLMGRAHLLVCRHLDRLNAELAKLEATTGTEIPDFKRDNIDLPAYLTTTTTPVSAGPQPAGNAVGFDFAQLGTAAGIGAMGAAGAIGTPGPTFKGGRRPIPTPMGPFQAPHLASLPPSHHPHAATHLSTSASNPYSSLHLPSHGGPPVLPSLPSQLSVVGGPPTPLGPGGPHHPHHPHGPRHRSRLHESATFHPSNKSRKRNRRIIDDDDDDDDEDAQGEEDEEMDLDGGRDADGSLMDAGSMGDEKDEELYCFCQRQSFGEMIGCDNPTCQYEWFHLSCVGLKATPANTKWFCPSCRDEKKRNGQPARARKR